MFRLLDRFPPARTIVCPCEDISKDEVDAALDAGFSTIEEVKRCNGIATGPCQGKICLLPLQRIVAEATGKSISEVGTITHRPPLNPIPLGLLGGEEWAERP